VKPRKRASKHAHFIPVGPAQSSIRSSSTVSLLRIVALKAASLQGGKAVRYLHQSSRPVLIHDHRRAVFAPDPAALAGSRRGKGITPHVGWLPSTCRSLQPSRDR